MANAQAATNDPPATPHEPEPPATAVIEHVLADVPPTTPHEPPATVIEHVAEKTAAAPHEPDTMEHTVKAHESEPAPASPEHEPKKEAE